jgi:hypothetical protein
MGRRRRGWAVLAMTLAMGCAAADGGAPMETSNKPREYVLVQFTDVSLHPSVARVLPGGSVAWINYATNVAGVVIFPETGEDIFTCDELAPQFAKVPAGYQSMLITDDVDKVGLPCPLKTGAHPYELRLFEINFGSPDDPLRTFQGKIVVE